MNNKWRKRILPALVAIGMLSGAAYTSTAPLDRASSDVDRTAVSHILSALSLHQKKQTTTGEGTVTVSAINSSSLTSQLDASKPSKNNKAHRTVKAVLQSDRPMVQVEATSSTEAITAVIAFKTTEAKQSFIETHHTILHDFSIIPAVSVSLNAAEIAELQLDPEVDYIDVNKTFQLTDFEMKQLTEEEILLNNTGSPIPAEESQWNLQAVKAPLAWTNGYTGAGVKVAIIDSGISAHPELTVAGGTSTVNYTQSWSDDNGHGTHVAGIIGAHRNNEGLVGVAPGVQLYAVKSIGADGEGDLLDILEGVDWAIANNMDIINLSLGTDTDSQMFRDLSEQAAARGIMLVAAGGNTGTANGTGNTVNYPAKYLSTIAVAAVEESMTRSPFSSTGAEIEFAAPGSEIISTYLEGQYAQTSGTSQAAPHISGLLALLMEQYPQKSGAELRQGLISLTDDLGTTGRDEWYGYGFTSYGTLSDTPPEQPDPLNDELITKIKHAEENVTKANSTGKLWDYDTARHSVEMLPETSEKTSLLATLEDLKHTLNLVEFDSLLNVTSDKVFTVTFTKPIHTETINSANIFIRHNGEYVNGISLHPSEDGTTLTIQAPEAGFLAGETYYLYVDKTIQTPNRMDLKFPVVVRFTVQ